MIKRPEVIHWMITSRCNLECPFCFSSDRKDLDFKQNLLIAKKIIQLGIKKIVISGGEPLVRKDIFKILRFLKKNGLIIRLDTNGLLLPKYIDKLNMLDAIGISLDGPTAAIDQKMRHHPKHFELVVISLEKLQATKMQIIIHTLATKINYHHISQIAKLLGKYPIKSWSIFEYCPYGKAYANRKQFELEPGQFSKLMRTIKYKGKIDFCRIKDRIRAYYFINSDGSIYTQPAEFGPYPVLGNILNDDPSKLFAIVDQKKNKKRSKVF